MKNPFSTSTSSATFWTWLVGRGKSLFSVSKIVKNYRIVLFLGVSTTIAWLRNSSLIWLISLNHLSQLCSSADACAWCHGQPLGTTSRSVRLHWWYAYSHPSSKEIPTQMEKSARIHVNQCSCYLFGWKPDFYIRIVWSRRIRARCWSVAIRGSSYSMAAIRILAWWCRLRSIPLSHSYSLSRGEISFVWVRSHSGWSADNSEGTFQPDALFEEVFG